MTREEAIQVLNMVEAHGSLVIQAKEMAIKALEEQADGEYIKKSDMIEWLKDIRHKMKPQNYHTASEFEIAENQIWNFIQMLQMGSIPSMAIPTEEPKTEWIPVSEGLPEQYCLFCDIDGDVFYGHIFDGRWWAEGKDDRIKNVVAWMPLPKPYKEG